VTSGTTIKPQSGQQTREKGEMCTGYLRGGLETIDRKLWPTLKTQRWRVALQKEKKKQKRKTERKHG